MFWHVLGTSEPESLMPLSLCEKLFNFLHLCLQFAVQHRGKRLLLLVNLGINCLDLDCHCLVLLRLIGLKGGNCTVQLFKLLFEVCNALIHISLHFLIFRADFLQNCSLFRTSWWHTDVLACQSLLVASMDHGGAMGLTLLLTSSVAGSSHS